jgi:hypothetical protein
VEENPGPGAQAHSQAPAAAASSSTGPAAPASSKYVVAQILDCRSRDQSSRASRLTAAAGINATEVDILVEWEGYAEPTWIPAGNLGKDSKMLRNFLSTRDADAPASARPPPSERKPNTARPGTRRRRSSATPTRSRRARRPRRSASAEPAAACADSDDDKTLEQFYDDKRPLSSFIPAAQSPDTDDEDHRPLSSFRAAAQSDVGADDHNNMQRLPHDHRPFSHSTVTAAAATAAPAASSWRPTAGWRTLPASLVQTLIPDGVPALAANDAVAPEAESGSHLTAGAPVSDVAAAAASSVAAASDVAAASHVSAAYQVTRVVRMDGSDWHRWRHLDVLSFPTQQALLLAMKAYSIESRMQYWEGFCSPAQVTQLAQLSSIDAGEPTADQLQLLLDQHAVSLFSQWMLDTMHPAAPPEPQDLTRLQLCACCTSWQEVLDRLHFDEDDKQVTLRTWRSEPVWLCVYTRL